METQQYSGATQQFVPPQVEYGTAKATARFTLDFRSDEERFWRCATLMAGEMNKYIAENKYPVAHITAPIVATLQGFVALYNDARTAVRFDPRDDAQIYDALLEELCDSVPVPRRSI
jgi:hypothetical protein